MSVWAVRLARQFWLCCVLCLVGCAAPVRPLQLDISPDELGSVWPAAETEEPGRYRYLGQLLGQQNYRTEALDLTTAQKVMLVLTGAFDFSDGPNVLQRPQSGAVDADGRVLVTDVSRAAVLVFEREASEPIVWKRAAKGQSMVAPIGLLAMPDGTYLVSDAELGQVFRLASDGTPMGPFGEDVLQRPAGLALDETTGHVFVADVHGHDIKVFDASGKHLMTWGKRGEGEGEFNYPSHLYFGHGRLMVSDTMNARVQLLNGDGEVVLTVGQRGLYVGNMVRPKGVTMDDEGNLYVVESMYDRVLVYDKDGRFLMDLGGTGTQAGKFYLPAGVWMDKQNRLYVSDMFNGRVMIFQFLGGS